MPFSLQARGHCVPVESRSQADHVDKPAHPGGRSGQVGRLDARDFRQALLVPACHLRAAGQQLGQAAHLHLAQGGAHLVQAVVVAQVGVLQPGVARGAALVAQGAHQRRRPGHHR